MSVKIVATCDEDKCKAMKCIGIKELSSAILELRLLGWTFRPAHRSNVTLARCPECTATFRKGIQDQQERFRRLKVRDGEKETT